MLENHWDFLKFFLKYFNIDFMSNSWIAMSTKFPWFSKRSIMPGIIDFTKLNYEELEELVAGGQGSFGVNW